MWGRTETIVLDVSIVGHVQSQLRNMLISGNNSVSCVATFCRSGGYLAQHALSLLSAEGT